MAGVVGACGVQDTPPGNADVSLAARRAIDSPVVEEAVAKLRLVLTWSLWGAPHVFPPEDFAVFTLGALPAGDTLEALWREPRRSLVEIERAVVASLGANHRRRGGERSCDRIGARRADAWCAGCRVHHPRESVFRATSLLGRIVLTSTAPDILFPDPAARKSVFAPLVGKASCCTKLSPRGPGAARPRVGATT